MIAAVMRRAAAETPPWDRLRRRRVLPADPQPDLLRSPAAAADPGIRGGTDPLLAGIDAVFVLNLRQDIAKWSVTAEALSRHELAFERFPAVDGNREELAAEWRAYVAQGLQTEEEHRLGRRLIESPGAWGYLKTMEALLETAKARELQRFVVFDDDVLLHHRFGGLVAAAWKELPPDWMLVYLGCTQTDWTVAESYSDHLYRPAGMANGSFAYALDAAVFDMALEEVRRLAAPFDVGALQAIDRAHPSRTFAVRPQAAAADVTASSIRRPRDLTDAASRAGWDPADYERRGFALASSSGGKTLDTEGLVSVILIVDGGDDATPTLTSLRMQTHGKLEILVMGNGLTDEALGTLGRMRLEDSRIRLFSTGQVQPPQTAINAALARARGEFIAFTSPRRVSLSHHLEACLQVLISKPSCYAVRAVAAPVDTLPPPGIHVAATQLDWARSHRAGMPRPSIQAGIIRRQVLETCGGLLASTDAAIDEWVRRAGLARRREASSPLCGPDISSIVAVETNPDLDSGNSVDWNKYHSEIAERLRPVYRSLDMPVVVVESDP